MIQFGTDGIRGRAFESPCSVEVARRIGGAAVALAQRNGDPSGRVIVGLDTRPSGPVLARAVAEGICSSGGVALNAGVIPTAGLSVSVGAGMAAAGVMLTASHNPVHDNGFKLFSKGGQKLSDEENTWIESLVNNPDIAPPVHLVFEEAAEEALEVYQKALSTALSEYNLQGLAIAVDLSAGAAVSLKPWLTQLPNVNFRFVENKSGVINDNCGSQHPQQLARKVVEWGCDAGFAVDGDADRCRLVDSGGVVIHGDALAWVLTKGLNLSRLAVTVMSNGALEASLPDVQITRTQVGDRHLAAAMKRQQISLGCEESGHVLFEDALPTGDGIVTGLRAISLALQAGGFSQALDGFDLLKTKTLALPVSSRPPLASLSVVNTLTQQLLPSLGPGGRIFLRYSGTEPVARILVEGNTVEAVAVAADAVSTQLAKEVG